MACAVMRLKDQCHQQMWERSDVCWLRDQKRSLYGACERSVFNEVALILTRNKVSGALSYYLAG